jgi:glutathione peroxidase
MSAGQPWLLSRCPAGSLPHRRAGPPLLGPSLQFGGQEPGEAAQIESFVVEKYAVGFPLMAKVEVNGPSQHPVFAWLKAHSPAGPGRQKGIDISWNFEKFLVDKHGRAVKRYGSDIQAHELEEDVYNELTRGEAEAELR